EHGTQPRAEGLVHRQVIVGRLAREKAVDGLELAPIERIDIPYRGRTGVSRYRIDRDEQRSAPPGPPVPLLPRGEGDQQQNQQQYGDALRPPPTYRFRSRSSARRQSDGSTVRRSISPSAAE